MKNYYYLSSSYGTKDFVTVIEHQVKKGSKWVTEKIEVEDMTYRQYRNMISDEWAHHYNNLGGSFRRYKNFTSEGYIVTDVSNVSPNGKERMLVRFTPSSDFKMNGRRA